VVPTSTSLKSNDVCWCGSGRKYKRCHKPLEGRVLPGRITPGRAVPLHIPRPPYAETGVPPRRDEPNVKTPEVIERLRHAGRIAAEILTIGGAAVRPGITTDELDAIVHAATVERDAYPSPLGYRGYPKSVCTSVNEVICLGIPDDRALLEGDIVNVDVTAYVGGVHGDTSATYAVGAVDERSALLVQVTRECLELGIEAVRPGRPISDIGAAIEQHARVHGFGVVRAFIGHGIGEQFHTSLQIPHYYDPRYRTKIETGMTFTIEPMISIGPPDLYVWDDDWTAATITGQRTAQYEHTLLVTDDGVEILTVPADGRPAEVVFAV
jgi:methionyl aminopeptidase